MTCNNSFESFGGRSMCDRNPRHEEFDRSVAKWETIRHYEINSYDTVKPIRTVGLAAEERFDAHYLGRGDSRRFEGGRTCGHCCR